METRSAKRTKLLSSYEHPSIFSHDNEDRISNLPNDILHQILFLLPLKSIARTSVLSKRWKNIWYSFPNLDFTTVLNTFPDVEISETEKTRSSVVEKRALFVDQIINLLEKHCSDISILKFCAFLSFSRLNKLIRNAVKCNVQELDVEVSTNDYFNFPRSVLSCEALQSLRLKSWDPGFRLPPVNIMKDGFHSLSSLSLSRVLLCNQPLLDNLFTKSAFPFLKKLHLHALLGLTHLRVESLAVEELTIGNCVQMTNLDVFVQKLERLRVSNCFDAHSRNNAVHIDAPMLKSLFWSDNAVIQETILQKLSSLKEATLGFFLVHEGSSAAQIQSLSVFLLGISSCRSLTLQSQCIEILSKNKLPEGVTLCNFNKLKSLELTTIVITHNDPILSNIFKISPNVDTLTINVDDYYSRDQILPDLLELIDSMRDRYWEPQAQNLKSFLHNIKVVSVHGFNELCIDNIILVKFLLNHGKVLEEVSLFKNLSRPRDCAARKAIRSDIMGFSRASPKANIVFQ